ARRGQPARFLGRRANLPLESIGLSSGTGELHDGSRTDASSRGNEGPAMNVRDQFDRSYRLRSKMTLAAVVTAGALGLASLMIGCGSREGENEAKMTSYSTGENKNDTADLFTVPQDQMAHVQVVTVEKSKVPRTLRLTGAVAYNAFKTTPVFSAV